MNIWVASRQRCTPGNSGVVNRLLKRIKESVFCFLLNLVRFKHPIQNKFLQQDFFFILTAEQTLSASVNNPNTSHLCLNPASEKSNLPPSKHGLFCSTVYERHQLNCLLAPWQSNRWSRYCFHKLDVFLFYLQIRCLLKMLMKTLFFFTFLNDAKLPRS